MTTARYRRAAAVPAIGIALVVVLGACADDSTPAALEPVTGETAEATSQDCVPGPVVIEGIDGLAFCGPADADVVVGTRTVEIAPGRCESGSDFWSANLGTTFPGEIDPPAGFPYVGTSVGSLGSGALIDDGDIPDALLALTDDEGASFQVVGTLTLSAQGTIGFFSGTSVVGREPVDVTIRCGSG